MHGVMFPIVGSVYLVSYYEDIDEFCATVEIEVPQNVSHVRLQLEKFGPIRVRAEPHQSKARTSVYRGPGSRQAEC
jgi:hypothetical protein